MEVVVTTGAINVQNCSQVVAINKSIADFLQAGYLSCRPTGRPVDLQWEKWDIGTGMAHFCGRSHPNPRDGTTGHPVFFFSQLIHAETIWCTASIFGLFLSDMDEKTFRWRFSVAVTRWSWWTQLHYIEPG